MILPFISNSQEDCVDKEQIHWFSLEDAEILSKKNNKNMLLFFYRENCEYCEKMKNNTFSDLSVVKLINDNFFPVMLNGKSKEPIIYNNKKYLNDKPNLEDGPYFHNLYKELVEMKNGNYYWPTIVIVNGNHEKIIQGQGFWPKEQTLRNLRYLLLE
jgi:thioredoxin-related protein